MRYGVFIFVLSIYTLCGLHCGAVEDFQLRASAIQNAELTSSLGSIQSLQGVYKEGCAKQGESWSLWVNEYEGYVPYKKLEPIEESCQIEITGLVRSDVLYSPVEPLIIGKNFLKSPIGFSNVPRRISFFYVNARLTFLEPDKFPFIELMETVLQNPIETPPSAKLEIKSSFWGVGSSAGIPMVYGVNLTDLSVHISQNQYIASTQGKIYFVAQNILASSYVIIDETSINSAADVAAAIKQAKKVPIQQPAKVFSIQSEALNLKGTIAPERGIVKHIILIDENEINYQVINLSIKSRLIFVD